MSLSSSDLQVVFPAIIFIALVIFLSGFFLITDDGVFHLNSDNSVTGDDIPISKSLMNNTGNVSDTSKQDNILADVPWWTISLPFGLLGVGLGIVFPESKIGMAMLLGGVGIPALTSPQAQNILHSLPVIGTLMDGLNYIGTALSSFMSIMTWSPGFAGGFPIIGVLIVAPLTIFFFIFVIRFIRGQ